MTARAVLPARIATGVLAWTVALLLFFPIFWMVVTSFKSETDAITGLAAFPPTLRSYAEMFDRADYFKFALNSLVISIGGTGLALGFALPAAYAMAFHPTRRTRGLLLWMLSTKMLPPVGVLMPMFLIFRALGLLDTRVGLLLINALINLPIAVWMLFTFFKEIPRDILEAGRMDGARVIDEIRHLLLPLALPGVASTALLSLVLRQALGRIHRGGRADPRIRLARSKANGAWADLRCGEIVRHGHTQLARFTKELWRRPRHRRVGPRDR
jgi:sorbitol/mannitol transport system permease protein